MKRLHSDPCWQGFQPHVMMSFSSKSILLQNNSQLDKKIFLISLGNFISCRRSSLSLVKSFFFSSSSVAIDKVLAVFYFYVFDTNALELQYAVITLIHFKIKWTRGQYSLVAFIFEKNQFVCSISFCWAHPLNRNRLFSLHIGKKNPLFLHIGKISTFFYSLYLQVVFISI